MIQTVTSTLYGCCKSCRVIRWGGTGQPVEKHLCAALRQAWRVMIERRGVGR